MRRATGGARQISHFGAAMIAFGSFDGVGSKGPASISRLLDLANVERRVTGATSSVLVLVTAVALTGVGCAPKPMPAPSSPRLHLAAVLYGKYLSANDGEMPADEQELIEFVDANEKDVLQRHGFDSAQEVFAASDGKPRLVVLYRDRRERLQTNLVALEEQVIKIQAIQGQEIRPHWLAADSLGVSQTISENEANRILAEADNGPNQLPNRSERPAVDPSAKESQEKDIQSSGA